MKKKNWYVTLSQQVNKIEPQEFINHQKALNKKICRIFIECFLPEKASLKDLKKNTNNIYYLMNVPILLVVQHQKNKNNVSEIKNMLKDIS